jgi:hyperosmotically inducible periplasmic protein
MKYTIFNSLVVIALAGCTDAGRPGTDSTPVATGTATTRRDNTEVNVRDRTDAVKTPIDQNENQRDIDITANIRKRVVDTRMSVNAQNAKIITQDGKVTLRGPVASVDEKNQIEKLAREVAGPENVVSQLEVQP